MSVIEIEKEIIDPLSRKEKEELFHYLAKELGKEDELLKYFPPGAELEIATPNISPDGSHLKTAQQLREILQSA
jgi:hypothetical protein